MRRDLRHHRLLLQQLGQQRRIRLGVKRIQICRKQCYSTISTHFGMLNYISEDRNPRTKIMDLLSGDDLIALKSSTSTWDGTQPPAYELSKRKAFNFSRPAALDTSPKDISQTTLNCFYKILVSRILMVISRIFLWILFSQ